MLGIQSFIKNCHDQLINGEGKEFEIAGDYLFNDRSLLRESLSFHQIGYCYNGFDFPDEVKYFGTLEKDKSERWDLTRNIKGRIVVPVFSEFGEIVGLATKKPTKEPGNPWWNLPKPFHKGDHLFLIDKAKNTIFKENKVYVVEGYADALTLYQNGLKNVVAVMGTAFTVRKLSTIARYCNNIVLCFDSDENGSGELARKKATAILNKYSFCESIRTIDKLPLGEDPDSFVKREGLSNFLNKERVMDEEEISKICIELKKKQKK